MCEPEEACVFCLYCCTKLIWWEGTRGRDPALAVIPAGSQRLSWRQSGHTSSGTSLEWVPGKKYHNLVKLAGLCLGSGWQLRQSRLSLVCPGSSVQPQARLGQVRRQGEGRDGPAPAAARALGQGGEVGYLREERGSVFLFLVTPLPPNSLLPPVHSWPLRLLRHRDQGTYCKWIRLIPFLFWLLYFSCFLK